MKLLTSSMRYLMLCTAIGVAAPIKAQDLNVNLFTHLEFDNSDAADAADRTVEWGESALFESVLTKPLDLQMLQKFLEQL